MIKLLLIFFTLISSTYAKGPFEGLSGEELRKGPSRCSSSANLFDAITSTGVNLLDEHPKKIWHCKKAGKDCPDVGLTCYSNSSNGFPAICLKKPRIAYEEHNLAEDGQKREIYTLKRPRFDAIYTLKKGITKNQNFSNRIEMDKNGCHGTKAFYNQRSGSTGSVGMMFWANDCLDRMVSLIKGKYCDASKGRDPKYYGLFMSEIEDMSICLKLFPNTMDRYKKLNAPNKKPEGNSPITIDK